MTWCLLILIFLPLTLNKSLKNDKSMQIKDLQLIKCDNTNYPVIVNNVNVQIGKNPHIKVSGSLSSDVDLVGPLKASVWLKRSIFGVWIPVPCEDEIGSCTYENLCHYGYPKNETCPTDFIKSQVPCRCPISKGNYTIQPTITKLVQSSSILSGKYKGTINLTQNDMFLSCYNIYFVLYDQNDIKNDISVILL